MHKFRRLMLVLGGAIALNAVDANFVGAMELTSSWQLTIPFYNLNPAVGADGTLRLLSGDNEFSPGAFDGDFDIDEPDEYFDLAIDGNIVGRYGCYSALGITNLNGDTSGDGCAFDQSFSFVDDFGLDLAALINGDRTLIIDAIFSGAVELSSVGNNLTVVLGYGWVTPPSDEPKPATPVPTPAAILPILGTLFSSAYRRARKLA